MLLASCARRGAVPQHRVLQLAALVSPALQRHVVLAVNRQQQAHRGSPQLQGGGSALEACRACVSARNNLHTRLAIMIERMCFPHPIATHT